MSRNARIAAVKQLSGHIHDYDYDEEGRSCDLTIRLETSLGRLLLVSLVESLAPRLVIRATTGIKRCALAKSSKVFIWLSCLLSLCLFSYLSVPSASLSLSLSLSLSIYLYLSLS